MQLSDIQRIHQMSKAERRRVIDAWRNFHNAVRKAGGRFDIYSPDEDVSIEEQFTALGPRGYDNNIVDYLGLLKGMDTEDQWRKLGAAARYAKVYTRTSNSAATLLAQLSDEGEIRYSRAIKEHASLMWQWMRPDDSGLIIIKQTKARNLKSFDFPLQMNFATMQVTDVDMSQVTDRTGEYSARSEKRRKNAGRREEENEYQV
jgi:hypothetical protein